ncbi:hypothetical protein FDW84_02650 [Pseudarthrobacter sp. NamE5]|nr:hypothetical protein FDW84_02650 [Pseudarthrobacter sp. NamE5]
MEVNQSRDQYGKQAIQLQFTNVSGSDLTVEAAQLLSPMFADEIRWDPAGTALVLPPGQPKSVPVQLPAAECTGDAVPPDPPGRQATASALVTRPGQPTRQEIAVVAADPFRVLVRNNTELCFAAAVAAVADLALGTALESGSEGRTAVVRLTVSPKSPAGPAQSLTIGHVNGTTLLAEPPEHPWTRNITVSQGDPPSEWRLHIRPARCDPHAVAEDKVGTLLPLQVIVNGREGQLKIAAGDVLRGQLYDFVTKACSAEQ